MKKGFWFKSLRALLVVAVAIVAADALVRMKPAAQRRERMDNGRLVEVVPAVPESLTMSIEAYGTVRPQISLILAAEVGGRVVERHPHFKAGGYLPAGAAILRIDPRDYRLGLARSEAQIAQTEAESKRLAQEISNLQASLRIARSDADLARAQLDRQTQLSRRSAVARTTRDQTERRYLNSLEKVQRLENQLALTGPLAAQLEARLRAARVSRRQAQLQLERTAVTAPFDAWVIRRSVETGQLVAPGQVLGEIYRHGLFEVEVRLPVKELRWLPALGQADSAPTAEIHFQTHGAVDQSRVWPARLTRLAAAMDQTTRTLPVIAEVDVAGTVNPSDTGRLRPGMFVTVHIAGRTVEKVFALPRHLLHPGDVVYLAADNRLQLQTVRVLRAHGDTVVVDEGLAAGDLIIETPLSSAVEGMKIRLQDTDPQPPPIE